ncbi:uracil-xanthine permease family protein [Candidatus Poriferisocius sp.]|uniref:uracil-xanthine permease family protein n=1 Tax=Candidatus Poriferisocius sp. TaxID=3101276 RepID=UPI003B590A77
MSDAIRYEANEHCPSGVAAAAGLQGVVLALAPIVSIVVVTARAGGQDAGYFSWSLFAAMIIAGVLTTLQASRFRRFGTGHILIMGPTPNFIAISVLALAEGGPELLASLTVVASLFYLVLAFWLPFTRRVITPVVTGTVLLLIAGTVLPVALDRVEEVPADAPEAAGPTIAFVTLAVFILLHMRASGAWRLWSPLIGIVSGSVVAVLFGAYEVSSVGDAAWVGIPDSGGFPGFDLTPRAGFWSLLPAFVVVTLAGGVKNMSDSVAIQQASSRRPQVPDFRLVQGSLNTNGLGILSAGIFGVLPTSVYSGTSVSLISFTGVAARRIGYLIGGTLLALAFLPKMTAFLLTLPSPVVAAYLLVTIALLFVSGIRTVVQDGLDGQKALVVGVAFALGMGLDNQTIFTDLLGHKWGLLLDNGMLVGAIAALAMVVFLDLTSPKRRSRLEVELSVSSLPEIDRFLQELAARNGWDEASAQRLRSAGEEALLSLVQPDEAGEELLTSLMPPEADAEKAARLIIQARPEAAMVEMEFLAVFDEENLEDRLAYLSEEAEGLQEGDVSLRLLRHYSSSVHHQKYHGLDIVTVQVRGSR